MDEKVVDIVEELSSPLKKVCCQCNRVFIYYNFLRKFDIISIFLFFIFSFVYVNLL